MLKVIFVCANVCFILNTITLVGNCCIRQSRTITNNSFFPQINTDFHRLDNIDTDFF